MVDPGFPRRDGTQKGGGRQTIIRVPSLNPPWSVIAPGSSVQYKRMDGPDDSVDQRLKITSTRRLLSVILQSSPVKILSALCQGGKKSKS